MTKARFAIALAALAIITNQAAQAAQKPLDPSQAQIVAVDRFSEKAAHLQVRKPGNGIPAANQPVDFDTGPFITKGFSPATGKPVQYYNFDVQGTAPAPVYVFYREGEDKPVEGQLDIIDNLPGEEGYNDFRQVWKVSVPKTYVANTITDTAELTNSHYKTTKTEALRNMPVVPDKSVARLRLNQESPALQGAWYHGKVAKFFAFNETKLAASDGSVPLSPIFVTFNLNPDKPNGGPASGFKTEPNSSQTHNVPATLPDDSGYSPLWSVSVYDNADWAAVRDLATVGNAKVLAAGVANVNCPIVSITP